MFLNSIFNETKGRSLKKTLGSSSDKATSFGN